MRWNLKVVLIFVSYSFVKNLLTGVHGYDLELCLSVVFLHGAMSGPFSSLNCWLLVSASSFACALYFAYLSNKTVDLVFGLSKLWSSTQIWAVRSMWIRKNNYSLSSSELCEAFLSIFDCSIIKSLLQQHRAMILKVWSINCWSVNFYYLWQDKLRKWK